MSKNFHYYVLLSILEFSKFATHHEHSRKKWLACEEENHDMKKYIAKYTVKNYKYILSVDMVI